MILIYDSKHNYELFAWRFKIFYGPFGLLNLVVYIVIIWKGTDFHTYFSLKNGLVLGFLGCVFLAGCIYFIIIDAIDIKDQHVYARGRVSKQLMSVVNLLNLSFFYGSFFYNGFFITYFKNFSRKNRKGSKGMVEMQEYNDPI